MVYRGEKGYINTGKPEDRLHSRSTAAKSQITVISGAIYSTRYAIIYKIQP